jgi:hypothetical protein
MSNPNLSEQLHTILDIARWAPSVHNAQPWLIKQTDPSSLRIEIDKKWKPEEGDPTSRETIISLGILSEAIAIAANSVGLYADAALQDEAALITFTAGAGSENVAELVALLRKRCTDRSIYKPVEITPDMVSRLESARNSDTVSLKVTTDEVLLATIADLTSKGIGVALSSPNFRKELSTYLTLPWSSRKRGIAVRSLHIPLWLELVEPLFMRLGIGLKAEVALEKRRWLSASGVVVILADGDMPKYWFEVGRSYLQVSLEAEAMGLSQATSAAIVEASNYQEDIEEALGTNKRLLALIRLGKGSSKKYYSPRLNAEELLTSN